ncbi:class I SAM-dependent methyltransferase [Halobacteria archaeon HArc-gm2]|nr:class I SAM-dependent methyltransferase [Halobacteria archaeon HArc-gm2]
MERETDGPVSREAYDDLAAGYEEITGAAIREHYEWPAVRSLLPDLDGTRVLDAACGDGFYTERLREAGATVVGVDASAEMVERALDRFADDPGVQVRQADLTEGLAFLDDRAFDLVLCQLALEHVRDWDAVFTAFHRVLNPGGRVVVSTSHPIRDYVDAEYDARDQVLATDAAYAEVERVDRDWGDEDEAFTVPFYRRPLAAVFGPPTDAGLLVERVVEPEIADAFRKAEPERARRFHEGPPNFCCLRFLKPSPA